MERSRWRPSPGTVFGLLALVIAVAGTAIAGPLATKSVLNKKEKKQVTNIAKNQVNKLASGLSVANAANLGNQAPSAFQTAAASDLRTDTVALIGFGATVLSANISTPAPKTVTAFASVEMVANGGGDDNGNCNLSIDGVDGARQSTYVTPNGLEDSTTLPLTQALSVGAGSHTVIVECADGGVSDTSVEDRSLSVVSTG